MKEYKKLTYLYSFKKSDAVITLSERSKGEIQDAIGISTQKIRVIPHGIDDDFKCLGQPKR